VQEDKILAHTARAEAEIACGRGHSVIGELESSTVAHPYREPLRGRSRRSLVEESP
jgi:DNA-binding SARP family transcriptional activator